MGDLLVGGTYLRDGRGIDRRNNVSGNQEAVEVPELRGDAERRTGSVQKLWRDILTEKGAQACMQRFQKGNRHSSKPRRLYSGGSLTSDGRLSRSFKESWVKELLKLDFPREDGWKLEYPDVDVGVHVEVHKIPEPRGSNLNSFIAAMRSLAKRHPDLCVSWFVIS